MTTPEAGAEPSARSPWLPVVLKVAGIAALLTGLAGIGAASMVLGNGGVAVARGAAPEPSGAWLGSEEQAPPERTSTGGAAARDAGRGPSQALTPDGKVILNLAEVEDLRRLPGIGKRRAEAIVELRGRLKRFRRVSDLLRVRGLGVRGLRRISPLVVLDAPKAEGAADGGAGDAKVLD